jgi:hypothetical protein
MRTEEMQQSIDAAATEAKEEKQEKGKRERRAKGSIDWGPIRKAWNGGLSVAEICERYNISDSTIYSQAKRYRWPRREIIPGGRNAPIEAPAIAAKATEKAIEQSVAQQIPAINAVVREKLSRWFEKVLATSDKLHAQVDALSDGRLEVEEIKSLASSLETIDRVSRRTFGLDSPSGSPVSVFSVAAPTISCPVIDVETIPEATPSTPS